MARKRFEFLEDDSSSSGEYPYPLDSQGQMQEEEQLTPFEETFMNGYKEDFVKLYSEKTDLGGAQKNNYNLE